jgi:hypothetical protein
MVDQKHAVCVLRLELLAADYNDKVAVLVLREAV